jgi:disulfide oxidoreductase YuzD
MRTTSIGDNIFSVDMMFAYINIFKPKYTNINIDSLLHNLEYAGWGDPILNIKYSPKDVINNPEKYKKEIEQIKNANLKYPIIIYNNNIIDGVHRLTKTVLEKKTKIKTYIFTKKIMEKFIIDKNSDYNKVDNMEISLFIELFYKKFL